MSFKAAAVQMEIKQDCIGENLARAEKFIKRASGLGAQLVVLPELLPTGSLRAFRDKKEFMDSEKNYLSYFQQLARKYSVSIVPGSWMEIDKRGCYNTAYYIDSSGKIRSKYRKTNLWITERRYAAAGNEFSVFNTAFGKVGLVLCWDLIFPEIFRRMAKRGVDIVICPSYWTSSADCKIKEHDRETEARMVDSLCAARTFENNIILIYCNAAGIVKSANGKTDHLIGHTQIVMPLKGAVKKLDDNKEDIILQEMDTSILKKAELLYKVRADLKKRIF
ncbi:MAG: carbon-nitrogen hydrolase family protein [Candidatus Aenigmarchaeota archaeon]|nr:carbon-nitrogen hydrolase family protein [Candidatus Aenigmarchaeota archaeon]